MKLLSFAASFQRNLINRTLFRYAAIRLQSKFFHSLEVLEVDLNDCKMPIYSIDRKRQGGIPAETQSLFELICVSDAVQVSFAEHNESVNAAWKNIFDWMS
jgi:NAD(P)H-dependent FMN reductase